MHSTGRISHWAAGSYVTDIEYGPIAARREISVEMHRLQPRKPNDWKPTGLLHRL
jgi:hypothetical protein